MSSDAPEADEVVLLPRNVGNTVTLSTKSIEDAPIDELALSEPP